MLYDETASILPISIRRQRTVNFICQNSIMLLCLGRCVMNIACKVFNLSKKRKTFSLLQLHLLQWGNSPILLINVISNELRKDVLNVYLCFLAVSTTLCSRLWKQSLMIILNNSIFGTDWIWRQIKRVLFTVLDHLWRESQGIVSS